MSDDPAQIVTLVIALRVGERVVLSLVVVLVALVCMAGFWRSMQKLDFSLSRDKLSGSGSVVLATPVFALLALIAFAWVSFSNPISVAGPPAAPGPQPSAAITAPNVTGPSLAGPGLGGPSFIGATPTAQTPVTDFDRNRTAEMIRALNCVASGADAATRTPRNDDALDLIRLELMEGVWSPDWGDPADFRATTLGLSAAPANPAALAFFGDVHPLC